MGQMKGVTMMGKISGGEEQKGGEEDKHFVVCGMEWSAQGEKRQRYK